MSFTRGHLYYQGKTVHRQLDTGLICLTDLWKVQGKCVEKSPLDWVRLEKTQKLLKGLIEPNETIIVWAGSASQEQSNANEQLIAEIPGILETTEQGDELWTYATEELATVYARFLSVECYEWALEQLVEADREETDYLERIEARAKAKQQREFSRRALITAGWAVPVVLSVKFNNKAVAAGSPCAVRGSQGESYCDNHGDEHSDVHNDHTDVPHTDSHGDHVDNHQDFHIDSGDCRHHIDSPTGYLDHTDSGCGSVGHVDNHVDNPRNNHIDTHADIPHGDS